MAPHIFTYDEFSYVQEHLLIISGLYGVLKPLDGVSPYRLEMQAHLSVGGSQNLYDYWENKIYKEILDDSHIIINLASQEYAKCVERYISKNGHIHQLHFWRDREYKFCAKKVYMLR